jgi:hypothetical protein
MQRRRFIEAGVLGATTAIAGCGSIAGGGNGDGDGNGNGNGNGGSEGSAPDVVSPLGDVPSGFADGSGVFLTRMNWEWYTGNYKSEISFGAEADAAWSLRVGQETFENPPENEILWTPVYGMVYMVTGVLSSLSQYSDVSQVALEDLGGDQESGEFVESMRSIDEVSLYREPSIVQLTGDIDAEAYASAAGDFVEADTAHGFTIFNGVDGEPTDTGGLRFAVKDGVAIFSAGRGEDAVGDEAFRAVLATYANSEDSLGVVDSVQSGSDALDAAPVLVGELAGGEAPTDGTAYDGRALNTLPSADTVLYGFETDGATAEAQVVMSGFADSGPSEDALMDAYSGGEAEYEYSTDGDVAMASAVWE